MDNYQHHVSGFFARREDAERALLRLVDGGLARDQLLILDTDRAPAPVQPVAGSHQVLMDVLKDGAIGTAVGTGVGVLTQLALVAANVSLFVASPLIAPLALLGWGASLGGFIGAAAGVGEQKGPFGDLVRDAIAAGQVVLLAETRTEQEAVLARQVIEAAVGDYSESGAA
ncbi:hypothetical protein [Zoogloea sp.]|uniref:hypothetical protein n=1 Tax=Zoogloea sp. TaxID=49181 RepID=UPI00262932C0|nr:hypothetical protein [Zoogloea sp.]